MDELVTFTETHCEQVAQKWQSPYFPYLSVPLQSVSHNVVEETSEFEDMEIETNISVKSCYN